MTWNYRIVRYKDGSGFGLHEIYYDKDGKAYGMTEGAARFYGDRPEEITESLLMAIKDAGEQLIDEPEMERDSDGKFLCDE